MCVLKPKNDDKKYLGYTKNLKFRPERQSNNKDLVTKKETVYGKRYIKNRLKSYLTG